MNVSNGAFTTADATTRSLYRPSNAVKASFTALSAVKEAFTAPQSIKDTCGTPFRSLRAPVGSPSQRYHRPAGATGGQAAETEGRPGCTHRTEGRPQCIQRTEGRPCRSRVASASIA